MFLLHIFKFLLSQLGVFGRPECNLFLDQSLRNPETSRLVAVSNSPHNNSSNAPGILNESEELVIILVKSCMLLHVVMRGSNSVLNASQVSLVLHARLRAFSPQEHKLVEVNVLLRCALAPRFVVQATASQSNDANMSNVFSIARVCTTNKNRSSLRRCLDIC